jgi:hypothetical protein
MVVVGGSDMAVLLQKDGMLAQTQWRVSETREPVLGPLITS